MKKKSKPRTKRKPASVDWGAVALEVEPNNPGRRAVLENLLVGASAEVDRLVALGDELNAAGSRALTEARRLIARLCGTLSTGSTKRVEAPTEYADLPRFVTFDGAADDTEPSDAELAAHNAGQPYHAGRVADDADLDSKLAQSFGAEVVDDVE